MAAFTNGFNKGIGKIMMRGKCADHDFELIRKHNRYEAIDFWDCRLSTLACVVPLKKLEVVCQYGGSVADYTALAQVTTLRELFLNSINQYGDLSFVKSLTQLNRLRLLYLNKLTVFPDLSAHTTLHEVWLWDCRRLTDINALAGIPNLESLTILGTPHTPDDLEFLLKLENLKRINATFGTVKANKRMDDRLRYYGKLKQEQQWRN